MGRPSKMRAFILLALIQVVLCASLSERAKDCHGMFCAEIYAPVCGTDGITYSNACELGIATCKNATVTQKHPGPCGVHIGVGRSTDCSIACLANWDPVCGNNGKTYGNDCELNVANCQDNTITKVHGGACADLLVS